MTQNEQEVINSINDTETTENPIEVEVIDTSTEVVEESEEEMITIPKKKWTEALATKEHWKKKASATKSEAQTAEPKNVENLSMKDMLAVSKAEVHEDDIEEVVDFAKYKKVSVAEALKMSTLKNILSERDEFRKTQAASVNGDTKRATTRVTEESLLKNALKGQMPESEDDIEKLFLARNKK